MSVSGATDIIDALSALAPDELGRHALAGMDMTEFERRSLDASTYRELFDASSDALFVHDMDGQLREFGIGDVVVGKHVGKLVGAMGGRIDAYRAGLVGDDAALVDAVSRNVTFGEGGKPELVASELRALAARLYRTEDRALLTGDIAP